MTQQSPLNVLRIDASARYDQSVSRRLTDKAEARLRDQHGEINVVTRDLARGIPFVDADWVSATFTPEADRSDAMRAALSDSDTLVEELEAADAIVIGLPIYNFGVPAALKAWFDQVARAGRTFRYTESGPEGLLNNKRAWVVVASGGVPMDSPVDFATPHVRQFLQFLGITDIDVVDATQLNSDSDTVIASASTRISELKSAA